MYHDFDEIIPRRGTESVKWRHYDEDVLPLWVADMDFRSPAPVIRALADRVAHGVFGYGIEPAELRQVIVERLAQLYGWEITPEDVVFVPGVVSGFNLVLRALARPGDGVLVQTPVYPPVLTAPGNQGLVREEMELTRAADGTYSVDMDAFEAAITGRTRLFLMTNPHNPVGRVFRPDELAQMADACLRHDLLICSDEIHCDLLFQGQHHTPIASIDPAVAQRTVTLMAPSKTYNIAGLECSFAVIQNAELRRRVQAARADMVGAPNILAFVAGLAAYTEGGPWLEDLRCYLEANRDFLVDYVNTQLPGVQMGRPEGTYLGWLDCRQAGLGGQDPYRFFLKQARVALNSGKSFGKGGEGFVRLNFGCPRSALKAALERMRDALLQAVSEQAADGAR
jgi:cystathionine beta-lyase